MGAGIGFGSRIINAVDQLGSSAASKVAAHSQIASMMKKGALIGMGSSTAMTMLDNSSQNRPLMRGVAGNALLGGALGGALGGLWGPAQSYGRAAYAGSTPGLARQAVKDAESLIAAGRSKAGALAGNLQKRSAGRSRWLANTWSQRTRGHGIPGMGRGSGGSAMSPLMHTRFSGPRPGVTLGRSAGQGPLNLLPQKPRRRFGLF